MIKRTLIPSALMAIKDKNLRALTYRTVFQLWSNFSSTWLANASEALTLFIEFESDMRDLSYIGTPDKIHSDILKILRDNHDDITAHLRQLAPETKQGERVLSNTSTAVMFLSGNEDVPQLEKTEIARKVVARPYYEPNPLEYQSILKKTYGY